LDIKNKNNGRICAKNAKKTAVNAFNPASRRAMACLFCRHIVLEISGNDLNES